MGGYDMVGEARREYMRRYMRRYRKRLTDEQRSQILAYDRERKRKEYVLRSQSSIRNWAGQTANPGQTGAAAPQFTEQTPQFTRLAPEFTEKFTENKSGPNLPPVYGEVYGQFTERFLRQLTAVRRPLPPRSLPLNGFFP